MLNKFVLIGVGGSGGKTLRYTWHELERRLSAAGWTRGVPDAWQFLHIDVTEKPDVVEGDVPVSIGKAAQYLGLATEPHKYPHYDGGLVTAGPLDAIAGWRVDPRKPLRPPSKGAGQRRVVGRVVTLHELRRVGASIDEAVRRLTAPGVDQELAELNAKLGARNTINAGKATAVVISSMGGGSGSGAYLDVIELLKRKAAPPNEFLDTDLVTVLFTADTFSHLAPTKRPGVEANSLAALSEFIAAFEHEGPIDASEEQLVATGGGVMPIDGARTGTVNFLVGAENNAISFSNGLDVYRAVGKAFAAFIGNESVQQEFQAYGPNADGAPCAPDFVVTTPAANARNFSSLGYANVSLGRSLFSRYAEERLAKLAINRLLRGHREGVKDADLRSNDALIAMAVQNARDDFFSASTLWELGEDHNQVLDKLRSIAKKKKRLDDLKKHSVDQLRAKAPKRKTKGAEWLKSFTSTFDAEAVKFEAAEDEERKANAQKWVPEVQKNLIESTATFVGSHGLPVTIGLLRELDAQVEEAASQLELVAGSYEEEQGKLLHSVVSLFQGLWDQVVGSNNESFDEAALRRRKALQRGSEAKLYRFTSELLRDVRQALIPSLIEALSAAQNTLERGENGEFRELVDQWSARELPTHLRAAPNERLLDDQAKFPEKLDELLASSFDGMGTAGGEAGAVAEIISGRWVSIFVDGGHRGDQTLLSVERPWWPVKADARPASQSASQAAFGVELTPQVVLDLSAQWVRERSPVCDYVRGTLAEWLDKSHSDAARRADQFVEAMREAVDDAAPLIAVSTTAHKKAHQADLPSPVIVLGDIPVGPGHRAYDRLVEILTAAGLDPGQVKGRFDPTAKDEQVEISSFLGWTVHPVAVSSLLRPIQQDWQARKDVGQRDAFWSYRRARQIPSFIPLAPSRQEALVRGWLTATALGYIEPLQGRWSERPLSIWTPRGPRAFPTFLLGPDPVKHASVLPALMESMILAYLSYSSGQYTELEAYMRLIELGTSGDARAGQGGGYREVHDELRSWINTGASKRPESGCPDPTMPPAKYAGEAEADPEQRRDALVEWLTGYREQYSSQIEEFQLTESTSLQTPRGWEIRHLVIDACRDLADVIGAAPLGDGAGTEDIDLLG